MSERRVSTAALSVVAFTAISTGSYVYLVRKKRKTARAQRPCRSPRDLKGNEHAKGSDVVNIYSRCLADKVYIVTGATSGLGRHTATLIGRGGAHVILAVRNLKEGQAIAKEIQQLGGGGTAQAWHLDLTSLDCVRSFASKFSESGKKLDGLINNAGVYGVKGKTIDGFQLTWQTNALAPALLTELLLPHMADDARIVHVSSEMERFVWSVSNKCPPQTDGSGTLDYSLSKACQVIHAHELSLTFAQEHSSKRAFAVEPGLVQTQIVRHASPFAKWINYKLLGPLFLRSIDQGCSTILFCLLAPPKDLEHDETNIRQGQQNVKHYYYANCAPKQPTKCCARLDEVEAQAKLFDELMYQSLPSFETGSVE